MYSTNDFNSISTQQMQSPQMGGIVQQSPEGQMPNQMNKTKTALANMLSNRLGNNNNGNYISIPTNSY